MVCILIKPKQIDADISSTNISAGRKKLQSFKISIRLELYRSTSFYERYY